MNKHKRVWGALRFWFVIGLVLPALLGLQSACRKKTVYTYDLKPLENVDPAMLCYKETARLDLDFSQCLGLAVTEDRIYVSGDRRLSAFSTEGALLWSRDLPGQAACLAGGDAVLYLGMPDHVAVYDPDDNAVHTWAGLGEKAIITALAAAGGFVYAADAGNKVVMCYTEAGKLEKILEGTDSTGFIIPGPYFDLAAAATGSTLWVVNPGKHRLEQFGQDGRLLSAWGKSGFGSADFTGCCNPIHMALLPGGGFVTAEKGIARVKVYNAAGEFQCFAAAPAQFKAQTVIADLAVKANGDILILDAAVPAVRIFSRDAAGMNEG